MFAVLSCWTALACTSAGAEPLTGQQSLVELSQPQWPGPTEPLVDPLTSLQHEAHGSLLDAQVAQDRQAVIRQPWQASHPTWIQGSATVNLGDFPQLDDPGARAEQDLKTLEWVIAEQRRVAAGQPRRDADDMEPDRSDSWLRKWLPRQWIAALKENRQWVAAGGTALLVVVWATAAFSRRPGSGPSPVSVSPEVAPSRMRTRRRRHGHHDGAASDRHPGSGQASGTAAAGRRSTRAR